MTSKQKYIFPLNKADQIDEVELRNALAAIAQEVQRYHNHSASDTNELESDENELEIYKTKLKMKRKLIKSLTENLKTACAIAKTVIEAKENESLLLNNHLSIAKDESANLLKIKTEGTQTIQKLTKENQALNDKLQNLHSFIELGYQELLKMRNETPSELSILMKLKQIMISCGQYYADYYNEHEKCLQLEQRNRFLNNKINILETNLATVTEQLKKFQTQKRKDSQKGRGYKENKEIAVNVGYVRSECQFGIQKNSSTTSIGEKSDPPLSGEHKQVSIPHSGNNFDLSSHLSLVRDLLNDQDVMLQDLKKLSSELGVTN